MDPTRDVFFESSHPLVGPLVRLQRAQEHIQSLEAEQRAFIEGGAYAIEREDDPEDPNREIVRLRNVVPPPVRVQVLAGECLSSMRSALDSLAWQLSLLTKAKPYDRTQFPILEEAPGGGRPIGRIPDVPEDARSLIRDFQPFTRPDPKRSLLWLLARLCDDDKHRFLLTIDKVSHAEHAIFLTKDATAGVVRGPMA